MNSSGLIRAWLRDDTGASFVELILIFPLAFALLLGTADIGYALILQRKLLSAAQSVADLLTREESISATKVTEAVRGGELILEPNAAAGLGYDVVGLSFKVDTGQPIVSWRSTKNMQADTRFPALVTGLGGKGEGVIAVVMTYSYVPSFFGLFVGTIQMQETAILRGRKLPLIPYTS